MVSFVVIPIGNRDTSECQTSTMLQKISLRLPLKLKVNWKTIALYHRPCMLLTAAKEKEYEGYLLQHNLIYYHVHVHSCIPAGVQKKLRFLTKRKHRAVGAGPAGPAAARPIFGQPTRANLNAV